MKKMQAKRPGAVAVCGLLLAALTGGASGAAHGFGLFDTINAATSAINSVQQVRGAGEAAPANAALGQGAALALGEQTAAGQASIQRAETALLPLRLASASCADLQQKQQATLNSLAEIGQLAASPTTLQLQEKLLGQRDNLSDFAAAKNCPLPANANLATGSALNTAALAGVSCEALQAEYSRLAPSGAAGSAENIQGAVNMLGQAASLFGGTSLANAQAAAQIHSNAAVANAALGAAQAVGALDAAPAGAERQEIARLAAAKGCRLN